MGRENFLGTKILWVKFLGRSKNFKGHPFLGLKYFGDFRLDFGTDLQSTEWFPKIFLTKFPKKFQKNTSKKLH